MNLRPSGYEPDELPGCSIPRQKRIPGGIRLYPGSIVREIGFEFLTRFGGDLLSHALRRSTIGATVLNCRVRDGIGCFTCAMTTKPRKKLKPGVLAIANAPKAGSGFCMAKPAAPISYNYVLIVYL